MVDDVKAKVEQVSVESCLCLEEGTDVELELVKYLFVNITVAVDQVAEKLILLNGLQMFLENLDTA
jgi:hypothetical protein